MDEITQPNSCHSRRSLLLKIQNHITATLITLTLLTSLFILLDAILPLFGILLNFSNYGHSMDPSIKGNALIVLSLPSRTPYENLSVGNVIMLKEPKGLNTATDKIRVHIHPISPISPSDGSTDSTDSTDSDSSSSDTGEITTPVADGTNEVANIEYLPDCAVLHRIVDIKASSTGERLLLTQGDANPVPDRYPVTADAYLGKIIGCIDYVRAVVLFHYERFNLLLVLTVVMGALSAIINRSVRDITPKS